MRMGDTIVALSSGQVPSGVAVIRLSGPAVRDLLVAIVGQRSRTATADTCWISVRETVLDRGLWLFFPGPPASPVRIAPNCRCMARRRVSKPFCGCSPHKALGSLKPANSPAALLKTASSI